MIVRSRTRHLSDQKLLNERLHLTPKLGPVEPLGMFVGGRAENGVDPLNDDKGDQYLVVAPGGHVGLDTELGDYVIACTLPRP